MTHRRIFSPLLVLGLIMAGLLAPAVSRADTTPPSISTAWHIPDAVEPIGVFDYVYIRFSESLNSTGEVLANYVVEEDGVPVPLFRAAFAYGSTDVVELTTQTYFYGSNITVTVRNVEDLNGNVLLEGSKTFPVRRDGTGGPVSPRLAVHVQPASSGKAGVCAAAPTADCQNFVSTGQLSTGYDLYVVLIDDVFTPGQDQTLAGASFGIRYDAGLSVNNWTLCGDLEFPGNGWPASRGGNVITFDAINNCQMDDRGDGIYAVLGSFYVYAYSASSLLFTPRLYVDTPDLKAANCAGAETSIDGWRTRGWAGFGSEGCNYCANGTITCAVPVRTTTWGSLKRQFSGEAGAGKP